MKKIIALVDYKNRFGSRYHDNPYRSGMDKKKLINYFKMNGFSIKFLNFSQVDFKDKNYKNQIFLYTSSEDLGGYYKSFIEDIIYGLKINEAILIPHYDYLKAHHNKCFMEILRDLSSNQKLKNIRSKYFGTIEELSNTKYNLNLPLVIKPSVGAMSKGVSLSNTYEELIKKSKKISRTKQLLFELRDIVRSIIHKGYIKESKYRKKFIVQNFVDGLKDDWKILIYGNKYYVLNRKNRKNDFRASGGGRLSYITTLPNGLLDFAKEVFESFDTPHLSLDIGFNNKKFFLIEFQFLYFGTYTLEHSDFYFQYNDKNWQLIHQKSELEKVYVESIIKYIRRENIEFNK